MAKVIKINPQRPDNRKLKIALEAIIKGGVIAYPTETVYGLGANAHSEVAVERIYQIKGRERNKPLSVIVSDTEEVENLVEAIPESGFKLMEQFWPGPLTIAFKAKGEINKKLLGGGDSIAIRVPASGICLELLRLCRVPLTSTSANLSGQRDPLTAAEVVETIGHQIDLIVDSGRAPSQVPSTVIDLTQGEPVVRRIGAISISQIERVIGKLKINDKR